MGNNFVLLVCLLAIFLSLAAVFLKDRKTGIVLLLGGLAASLINSAWLAVLDKTMVVVFFGPPTEELCRFLCFVLILGRGGVLVNRWRAGLGFYVAEGVPKIVNLINEIAFSSQSWENIGFFGGAVLGSAMLHLLITSIVLSLWRESKILAFCIGLGLHICHNAVVALLLHRASIQDAPWLMILPAIYLSACLTCFSLYDSQARLSRNGS